MSLKYSRHFFGINLNIHIIVLFYIWTVLGVIDNEDNGCKDREWLTCHGNQTTVLNYEGIVNAQLLILHGITILFIFEITFCIFSYIQNRNVKYYFFQNGFCEIITMILVHYAAGLFYIMIPILIWFCFFLICQANSGSDSSNDSGSTNNSSSCTPGLDGYLCGHPSASPRKKTVREIEEGLDYGTK